MIAPPIEDQWILSPEEYADLPAFKGTTLDEELTSRQQAAELIQKLGAKLKLPQTSIATAMVLMHRFYIREKFSKFPLQDICQAAVFLASKIDEHPRKIKDIIQVSLCVRFKTDSIDGSVSLADDNVDYMKMKDRLLAMEKIVLQTCCFDLTIKHPYNYIFRNVKLLQDKAVEDLVVQRAWQVVGDSFRTTICIRYPPKAVAAAAIYFAARQENVDLISIMQVQKDLQDPIDAELFPHAPRQLVHEIVEILTQSCK